MAVNEGQASRTRRTIAAALIVVASLVAFLALAAIWVNRQALNTDNWTRTSSQLLEQPVIRDRVAARLTDELYQSVDVQQVLSDALPPRAQVLAAPAANALRTQVEKTARKALARPDVQALWADANRTAHEQLLAVLNGGGTTVSTQNGEVVLNLQDLLAKLQQETGVGGRLRKVLPASATQVALFRSNQLSAAQTGVKILRPLPIVLLLVSLALFGIAVAIAPGWRRRALRAYGIGFIVVGLATLLARSLGGDEFVSSLAKTAAAEPAVRTIWSIGTELLDQIAVATIGYGVVMVLAAWLAGPTRVATATRRAVAPYWRSPVIAYSGLAVVFLILLWWAPTPAWRNAAMVLILLVLLAVGVEALRRQIIREFPDATREDANRRYRERWDNFVAGTRRRGGSLYAGASRTAQSATTALASTRDAATERLSSPQTPEDARLQQLERLAQLREAGILSDEELRAEKERILNPA